MGNSMTSTVANELPVDDRLPTKEVARVLKMHPKTLARNARRGLYNPAPVMRGRVYLWPRSLVRELLGLEPAAAGAGK